MAIDAIASISNLQLTLEQINKINKSMIFRVIIEWDEEAQAYSATCPELNFVSSFGDTKEKAIAKLQNAIKLMFEVVSDNF